MSVERVQGGTSLIDVLDRVLDKGIVIDAWVDSTGQSTPVPRPATHKPPLRFGSGASSRSALRRDDDEDG